MHDLSTLLTPMLDRLERRSRLSAEDRAALLALPYRPKNLEAGDCIVAEGEKPTMSCVLLRGYAYGQKQLANGGRQILSIHMAGDLVDLHNSFLDYADHSVQMLTAGLVAYIPQEALQGLAFARPRVGRALWLETLVDASITRQWLTNVGRGDARQRIAHLLCEFAVRLAVANLDDGATYELPMTQEQLGDATGLTAVHVNRTIKGLRSSGLIISNHRSVTISDWGGLQEAADFDPAYLHGEHANLKG